MSTIDYKWRHTSFWDEIDWMVPPYQLPAEANVAKGKQVLGDMEDYQGTSLRQTNTGGYSSMAGSSGEPIEIPDGSVPFNMYVRMMDPAGNVVPFPIKTTANPKDDVSDYQVQMLAYKCRVTGNYPHGRWILCERRSVRERLNMHHIQLSDTEFEKVLRAEFIRRRQAHRDASARMESQFMSELERKQLENQQNLTQAISQLGPEMAKAMAAALEAQKPAPAAPQRAKKAEE